MPSKESYIIISDQINASKTLGENIRETIAVATNFKTAYNLALSMGNISLPKVGYRSALRKVKSEYAMILTDKVGTQKVTIALVKKW